MKRSPLLTITAAAFVVAGASTASAAPPSTTYCAEILSNEVDAQGFSIVLGTSCSTSPEAALSTADAEADNSALAPQESAAAASTLLMNEYRDSYLGGGVLYSYYGAYGTCDSAGYRLRNYWDVGHSVSSIQGNGNCNNVYLTNYAGVSDFGQTTPVNVLPARYNDNVDVVRIVYCGKC
ncbi:hypothetical protein [Geodermatophilus sp. FMUSA9-8]|uniref:hypothetical protein n=1 Tax=Geodermatophilus sp. FMUSA9-8 TaxID=3120155 RepID=UPI00300B15CF